jgi:transcriptional regulator with XRE-family HTH domain
MSPVNVSAIGAYIREQREQAKISLRQLAQSAGISNPYLSQIERGLRRPSADILQQIAKGLRISAEALYVQAGFLEDRPPMSVVRDAVLTDPELTERQKQMLIEVYESFRKETAMARAEAAELDDDQTGLAPDEAALTWPENLSPATLAGLPRRLAIAAAYPDTDDTDDADEDEDEDDDPGPAETVRHGRYLRNVSYERGGSDRGEPDQPEQDSGPDNSRTSARRAPESKRHGHGRDSTIRQFPPPSGNG